MQKLYDRDPAKRRVDLWHEDSDGWVFESRYDVGPVIEEAKARYNSWSDYRPWQTRNNLAMHHVAHIPQPVMEKLIKERGWGWLKDEKGWKAVLNDPANRCFRTKPGRL